MTSNLKPYNFENSIRRRSTARLQNMLKVAIKTECECDGYHGFTCGKHSRIETIEMVLAERTHGA